MSRSVSAIAGSVSLVLATVLAFVQSLPGTRWIVVAVLGLIVVASVIREVATFREGRREVETKRDGALRQPLIAVRDADPFSLGVTPSAIADRYKGKAGTPPYVSREVDSTIDRLLCREPFVVITGPSKAGKSRTAYEAIVRNYPTRFLVAPELPGYGREGFVQAVEDCIEKGGSRGVVIWLDDLQEFLRARAIATQDVGRWREAHPNIVVVGTIRDGELAGVRGSSEGGTEIEKVLDQAAMIPLSPSLSEQEQADAEAAYPNEDFQDGIGVHLVAGPQLVERFIASREANPLGFAVAAAVVDRKRAGVFGAVSQEELLKLAPIYYRELRPRSAFPEKELRVAVEWAADPVIQDIAILLRSETGYIPFDYICAFRDGEVAGGAGHAPIPESFWKALIEAHSGWALRSIGESAIARGKIDLACAAFAKLADDPDVHAAAHGLDDYGAALASSGNEGAAIPLLRRAAASGYTCVLPSANYRLALALERTSPSKSESLYRTVLEHPDSWVYPKAAVNLGLLLRSKTSVQSMKTQRGTQFVVGEGGRSERDRVLEDEAKDLFELAMASHDVEAIANGANALGALLCSRGDMDEGERALRRGIEARSAQAAITLAVMIYDVPGREAEAWQLIDQAEEMAEPGHSGYLNFSAGVIAAAREDHDEALARFKLVAADGAEGFADEAELRMAYLFLFEIPNKEDEGLALLEELITKKGQIADRAEAVRDEYLQAIT